MVPAYDDNNDDDNDDNNHDDDDENLTSKNVCFRHLNLKSHI